MDSILFKVKNIKALFTVPLILFCLQATAQKNTVQKYIEAHKESAVRIMEKYEVPASIVLGVAIHESASGNSRLAKYLNNHFGIKGKNNSTEIRSAYKGYDSAEDSYRDFVNVLQHRRFNHLFDKYGANDYQSWALGIASGGYASSKTWATQVINIIKKYELDALDKLEESPQYLAQKNDTQISKSYVVRPGDTLSKIAKKNNTSVEQIQQANRLRNSNLQIGQELAL